MSLKDLGTGEALGHNSRIQWEERVWDSNSWSLGEEGSGIWDSWVLRRRALEAWTLGSMKVKKGGEGLDLNTLRG